MRRSSPECAKTGGVTLFRPDTSQFNSIRRFGLIVAALSGILAVSGCHRCPERGLADAPWEYAMLVVVRDAETHLIIPNPSFDGGRNMINVSCSESSGGGCQQWAVAGGALLTISASGYTAVQQFVLQVVCGEVLTDSEGCVLGCARKKSELVEVFLEPFHADLSVSRRD